MPIFQPPGVRRYEHGDDYLIDELPAAEWRRDARARERQPIVGKARPAPGRIGRWAARLRTALQVWQQPRPEGRSR